MKALGRGWIVCRRLSAGLLRQVTYTTTRLGIYNTLLVKLAPSDGSAVPFYQKVLFGVAAGACGAVVGTPGASSRAIPLPRRCHVVVFAPALEQQPSMMCPFPAVVAVYCVWVAVSVVVAAAGDLAMIRMMADGHLPVEHRRGYRHVGDALSQIVKADGVVGCWKGCSPTVVRAMALNGAQLGGYSQAKEGILKLGLLRDGVACHFAASLFAGFIATVVSIPVDMVKTRCVCVCVIVWVCAWCFEARPSPAPPISRSSPVQVPKHARH